MVNKKYLCAALTVGLSTAGGPFAMGYNIPESHIPLSLGVGYFLICFYAGFSEFYSERKNRLVVENPRKFCNGNKRLTIEELVSRGYLSLDE